MLFKTITRLYEKRLAMIEKIKKNLGQLSLQATHPEHKCILCYPKEVFYHEKTDLYKHYKDCHFICCDEKCPDYGYQAESSQDYKLHCRQQHSNAQFKPKSKSKRWKKVELDSVLCSKQSERNDWFPHSLEEEKNEDSSLEPYNENHYSVSTECKVQVVNDEELQETEKDASASPSVICPAIQDPVAPLTHPIQLGPESDQDDKQGWQTVTSKSKKRCKEKTKSQKIVTKEKVKISTVGLTAKGKRKRGKRNRNSGEKSEDDNRPRREP